MCRKSSKFWIYSLCCLCRQQKREDCHSTRIRLMGAQNGVLWKQLWHSDCKIWCCTCGTLITGWQTLGTEYSDRHMLGPAKTVAFSFCGLPNMDSSRRYNLKLPTKRTKQIEKMPPRFMGNFRCWALWPLSCPPFFPPQRTPSNFAFV
jgi:hypothetical protein